MLGAGPHGPVTADLVADGPHLLIEGPAGSGRTELLRAVVASLAAAERPDRLGMVLIDGRDGVGTGNGRNEGLRVCVEIPHVTTHLIANDPVRMREFAQSLSAELKRRAELLGRTDFAQWHAGRVAPGRVIAQRTPPGAGDIEAPPSSTLRLRPGAAARQRAEAVPPLPRLVVVVDDLDALVSPALGAPGRPAAGSVTRALEAVAREGERLGVHLVAAAGTDGRTADSEPARRATLRIRLAAPSRGPTNRPRGAASWPIWTRPRWGSRRAGSPAVSRAPRPSAPRSSRWTGTAWAIPHPPPRPRTRQRPHRPGPAGQCRGTRRPPGRGRPGALAAVGAGTPQLVLDQGAYTADHDPVTITPSRPQALLPRLRGPRTPERTNSVPAFTVHGR
ncbi:FtsK/SpoIIIE family protein [Streptomyces sp. DconLS]|nr:FtsK/SpoIIIE family protein [Streptomyces sp. DconLS]